MTTRDEENSTSSTPQSIEVRKSGVHGRGVFALRAFRAGQQIGTYAGRRYAPDEVPCESWNDQLTYLFGLSDGSIIDGGQGGNATRHINHACEPNVEAVEVYDESGELTVVIQAMRRIKKGAELFLDYALDVDGEDPKEYPCYCGSIRCRGSLAGAQS